MRQLLTLSALSLWVAGCGSPPREKIADALIGYGIAPAQAQCVGTRLEQRLTVAQLRELGTLVRSYQQSSRTSGSPTIGDLIGLAGQVQDARVPIEVGKAAANCGLLNSTKLGLLTLVNRH